jgi:hypothetical protein
MLALNGSPLKSRAQPWLGQSPCQWKKSTPQHLLGGHPGHAESVSTATPTEHVLSARQRGLPIAQQAIIKGDCKSLDAAASIPVKTARDRPMGARATLSRLWIGQHKRLPVRDHLRIEKTGRLTYPSPIIWAGAKVLGLPPLTPWPTPEERRVVPARNGNENCDLQHQHQSPIAEPAGMAEGSQPDVVCLQERRKGCRVSSWRDTQRATSRLARPTNLNGAAIPSRVPNRSDQKRASGTRAMSKPVTSKRR